MRVPLYRVRFRRDLDRHSSGPVGDVVHVVLQPRRAKGMDGVVPPVKEFPRNGEAFFDRFPDGEFDVVIVTEVGTQRYDVDKNDRARIR
jgi:hypothetical protein